MQVRTETTRRSYSSTEIDLAEVAIRPNTGVAQPPERSTHGIEHVLNLAAPISNYNTNTIGRTTFQRVEPMSRLGAAEHVVDDPRLQSKLEALCESLRARY